MPPTAVTPGIPSSRTFPAIPNHNTNATVRPRKKRTPELDVPSVNIFLKIITENGTIISKTIFSNRIGHSAKLINILILSTNQKPF